VSIGLASRCCTGMHAKGALSGMGKKAFQDRSKRGLHQFWGDPGCRKGGVGDKRGGGSWGKGGLMKKEGDSSSRVTRAHHWGMRGEICSETAGDIRSCMEKNYRVRWGRPNKRFKRPGRAKNKKFQVARHRPLMSGEGLKRRKAHFES